MVASGLRSIDETRRSMLISFDRLPSFQRDTDFLILVLLLDPVVLLRFSRANALLGHVHAVLFDKQADDCCGRASLRSSPGGGTPFLGYCEKSIIVVSRSRNDALARDRYARAFFRAKIEPWLPGYRERGTR